MVRPLGVQHVDTLSGFLRHPRYEVMPTANAEAQVLEYVPKDVTITVTASPGRGLGATLDLTVRLAGHGYRTVPHLAARMIRDRAELSLIVGELKASGVEDIFVIAGDAREPAGELEDSIALLSALPEGHGMKQIGVAGYPESHAFVEDDVTIQAMWDKRKIATYIVSNLCFDVPKVTSWVTRVRRRGVQLPVYIGMAGVTDPIKLLRVSTRIGLADSTRFLLGHSSWIGRLVRPGGYSPSRFVSELSPDVADPRQRIAGFHIFTFNEIGPTERWRQEMLARMS